MNGEDEEKEIRNLGIRSAIVNGMYVRIKTEILDEEAGRDFNLRNTEGAQTLR